MKFLDNLPELDLLSSALSYSSPSLRVTTRVEAYSCKPVSRERKLFKALEQDLVSDIELSTSVSPPGQYEAQIDSAFGPLDQRSSRKVLYFLIGTLNQAFPDFDFSSVRAEEFTREPSARAVFASLSSALNHLRASAATSTTNPGVYRSFSSFSPSGNGSTDLMADAPGSYETPTHPFIRQILDPIIDLAECEVYSYAPDTESDPHAAESERGSVAPSEFGDEESTMGQSEDGQWPMDGFENPPTPTSANSTRQLRSGKSYNTSPPQRYGFPNGRAPLTPRSRSATPSVFDNSDASSGLLWSCNYFLFNKEKKRILFISHHMRRVAPSGPENLALGIYNKLGRPRTRQQANIYRGIHFDENKRRRI